MLYRTIKHLATFVVLGVLFAVPGETLNQILSRHNPAALRSTLIGYALLLVVGFFVGKGMSRIDHKKARAMVLYYILFGTFGLMIEWFLLGNAPILDPFQVVTQPGMFTFWGTLLLAPRLLMEPSGFSNLKQSFIKFFVGYSLLYLSVAVIVPKTDGGIYFGFILWAAGTAALNFWYVQYFKRLADRHGAPGGDEAAGSATPVEQSGQSGVVEIMLTPEKHP